VLLEDLVAAVEQSADERLWRHVFYTPIEELQTKLRKVRPSPLVFLVSYTVFSFFLFYFLMNS
jgi:hypothetical protein